MQETDFSLVSGATDRYGDNRIALKMERTYAELVYGSLSLHEETLEDAVNLILQLLSSPQYDHLSGGVFLGERCEHILDNGFVKTLRYNAMFISMASCLIRQEKEIYGLFTVIKETVTSALQLFLSSGELFYSEAYPEFRADKEMCNGFCWTTAQMNALLKPYGELLRNYFGVNGENHLLYMPLMPERFAKNNNLSSVELAALVKMARIKMLQIRNEAVSDINREGCAISDNALMVDALLRAYELLKDESLLSQAEKSLRSTLILYRHYLSNREGREHHTPEDLLSFIEASLLLVCASFKMSRVVGNGQWISGGKEILDRVISQFYSDAEDAVISSESVRNFIFMVNLSDKTDGTKFMIFSALTNCLSRCATSYPQDCYGKLLEILMEEKEKIDVLKR